MDKNKLKFAVFGNKYHLENAKCFNALLKFLMAREASLAVESEFYKYINDVLDVSSDAVEIINNNDFTANFGTYASSWTNSYGDHTGLNGKTDIGDLLLLKRHLRH